MLLALYFTTQIEHVMAKQPIIRVEIDPVSVTVGKPAKLKITVLVPTWFTSPSIYPSFEKLNVITRLPPNSTYPITQRIDGESWSGILREYELYPQIADKFVYGSETIQVSYADPETRKPIKLDLPIPPVTLLAIIPAGAETLKPFLASTRLTLEQVIEGETDSLEPGDAIVLTTTATMLDMPVMFLPVLINIPPVDGLALYPKQPKVEETRVARQTKITSIRSESVIIVFEAPGDYLVPKIELKWWDVDTDSIQTASVPEHHFSVADVGVKPRGDTESTLSKNLLVALVASLALLTLVLLLWFVNRDRIQSLIAERRIKVLATEHYAFKALKTSIGNANKQLVYRQYLNWLERIHLDIRELSTPTTQYSFENLGKEIYCDSSGSSCLVPISAAQQISLGLRADEIRLIARTRRATLKASSVLPALNA
jgi:hypothetical protein